MSELDDAIKEFLVESHENLDRLDTEMVTLEVAPDDQETLASIFRTIHTIKGTCGFLGYSKLESVTHVGESLLERLRDGELRIDDSITSALLAMVDAVRRMLAEIEQTGAEGAGEHGELVQRLLHLQEGETASAKVSGSEGIPSAIRAPVVAAATSTETHGLFLDQPAAAAPFSVRVGSPEAETVARPAGEALSTGEAARAMATPRAGGTGEMHAPAGVADTNIRVDVGLLDRLMNLVGELVLARNQILQLTSTLDDSVLTSTSQRLNLVTTELQESVMKTRMQPIGNVWAKFPRVVRDVSKACGKEVRLELEGKETELDKTIIEAIKDPLTHIVRNSIDHGIEPPAVRRAAGKPAEGLLRMRAYHEGGQVNIEIIDDGCGIHTDKVKAMALERGLITVEQAARMSEHELVNLIFLPGFSTAAKVTNVSGRGVGMDVVRTNIEKIGGTVDVASERDRGTTLKIKIPLTLAIIPALVVTDGGDRYAIPQVSLLELVRLEPVDVAKEVEDIHGTPVYRLRGKLLPLVRLATALDVATEAQGDSAVNIVVLQADEHPFGLIVEEINDTEEIVVRPLGHQLEGITAFAGATIMGDGRVALILDVLGLAQRARVVSSVPESTRGDEPRAEQAVQQKRPPLLLFRAGEDRRMAIPLSDVARLEEFQQSQLEHASEHRVVQYRGEILPVVGLAGLLGYTGADERDPIQAVVYSRNGNSIGLQVDQILDIVEEPYVLCERSRRPGILGSAVIQSQVTDILDLEGVLRGFDPTFFERPRLFSTGK